MSLKLSRFGQTKFRAAVLLSVLVIINLAAWLLTYREFSSSVSLMAMAFLAYSFGLRHAVDADHIAAIDNVTRKLMQQGSRPVAVGTFFSLGHSTIVILASLGLALTAASFKNNMDWFKDIGGTIGTLVSSSFLVIFGIINFFILVSVYKKFKQIKQGSQQINENNTTYFETHPGGVLTRIFKSMFNLVNHSWQMFFVGFLFGLGFDTATEVGILGISATNAYEMNVWSIMIFPILFTSGMTLIDTLDNFVMVGTYGWAFSNPIRKLYYNMTITGVSVVIALFIGSIESLGLLIDKFDLSGGVWDIIGNISDNFGLLGYWTIGLFICCWIVSVITYYAKGYNKLSV